MATNQARCPICGGTDNERLYPEYRGRTITTQMLYCDGIELNNRWCAVCGFIWNAEGLRHGQEIMFDTGVQKPKPQIVSFAKGQVKPLQQRTLETFIALADIPESGSMLDFGAGYGAFLRHFHEAYPKWTLSGIEPKDDFPDQVADLPMAGAYNRPYNELDLDAVFDMIVVMSVLEHVPDPLHALNWIYDRLKPGGLILMRHPDFAKLPGDLFCADHISKMTVPHTRQLVEHAGFEVLNENSETMLFYFILRKADGPLRPLPDCAAETLAIARQAEHVARRTIASVETAVASAAGKGSRAAVFGTSPIGSMAHLLLDCKAAVACFVDENRNTWGREIDGLPVVGPERMAELGVSDLALAISPLYWESVAEKMRPFGVTVHVPNLD